jgi:hypothetical protein
MFVTSLIVPHHLLPLFSANHRLFMQESAIGKWQGLLKADYQQMKANTLQLLQRIYERGSHVTQAVLRLGIDQLHLQPLCGSDDTCVQKLARQLYTSFGYGTDFSGLVPSPLVRMTVFLDEFLAVFETTLFLLPVLLFLSLVRFLCCVDFAVFSCTGIRLSRRC